MRCDRLLMSRRHQVVHSQVLHHLPVVIPRMREENRRRIESRSLELLDVRISDLFQQVLICQGADALWACAKASFKYFTTSSLLVKFLGPS